MSFLQIYLLAGLVVLLAMSVLWFVSLLLTDASIVDIFWGTGFVITVWIYFLLTPQGFLPRKWLVSLLVTIWGIRLSLYILWRNWGKGEDFRYRKWRQEAGEQWWWRSYIKVFLLQWMLLWIISIPLLAAQIPGNPAQFTPLDFIAILVWLIGFFFEFIGDWQLARFKADPINQGKIMQSGLWRYTRHPNYFGDAAQWWGYYLVAAAVGAWWTIYSPILMTLLLVRVSGITMLEKSLKVEKPGYRDYIKSTSAFIPWFPKD